MTNEEAKALPNNIKQIGNINNECRIYMEDYACTYLNQYSSSDDNEKIAILIGRNLTVDNENILFISGVIQGKYTTNKNGIVDFSEKCWQYVQKQINLYFKDQEVVGWAYVQPGYEDYISEKLCNIQKSNVTKGLQVLYIIDPSENISSFYRWNSTDQTFNNINGYIIYYEKNEGMHEYMLENKIKSTIAENIIQNKADDAGSKAREIAKNKRPNPRKINKKATANPYKALNLMGTATFIMLLVSFIMGAGLLQNDDRISQMESKIIQLEHNLKNSQSVFAAQSSQNEVINNSNNDVTSSTETAQETLLNNDQKSNAIASEDKYTKYEVKAGDTLLKISKEKYGTSTKVAEIRELNDIVGNKIVVGDILLLP